MGRNFAIINIMNEIYFFLHTITVTFFVLGALRVGKEALIAAICLQTVLANLFVVKQMSLFGLDATCSDVFIIGSVLGLNLLQEYFGPKIAKKTVWINFLLLFFYVAMSQFHLLYSPNSYDNAHNLFKGILQFAPRITIASILVHLIVQRIDCSLYAFLKKIFNEKHLVARNIFSIFCTQFLDTVLFTFLGLYGIVGSVLSVIAISFMVKVMVILVATPFVAFCKKIMKRNIVSFEAAKMEKKYQEKSKIKETQL